MQHPSWSFSSYKTFRSCRRCYFFDKYYELCKDKYYVLALKRMTAIPLLAGNIVHGIIAQAVSDRFRYDRIPPGELLERAFRTRFAEAVKKSESAADKSVYSYMSDCLLEEYYYNEPDVEEKLEKTTEKCLVGLRALSESKLWNTIMTGLKPENLCYVEREKEFPFFVFEGIRIYAKIDFAVQGTGWNRIFDWKTGRPGKSDRTQLSVYGMYAASEWGWQPEKAVYEFVYLNENTERVKEQLTREDIAATAGLIRSSYAEILALYNDGCPDIEDYEKTEGTGCSSCRYREICSEGTPSIR